MSADAVLGFDCKADTYGKRTEVAAAMKTIRFYREREQFGFLSNFAPYQITLKDRVWPTNEHYFQAQKFADTEHEEAIRQAVLPRDAKRMGRDRKYPIRADWEQVKDSIMLEALRAKFTQHPGLESRLLDTGDATLIEHTPNDTYWADGGDGSGKNRLGELLMQVREEIRTVRQQK